MYYPISMGRIPLIPILYAVFLSWGVVYLSGCVEPVDLSSFAKDKDVVDIVDNGEGIVNISSDSDFVLSPDLKPGNKKITGLNPQLYYMVEEWDENGNPKDPTGTLPPPQFVSPSGERSASLANIGLVKGEEITGLTNYYHYRVKVAKPLSEIMPSMSFTAAVPSSSGGTRTITAGAISLPGPTDNSTIVYTLTPPSFPSFEIAEVPISPAGSSRAAMRPEPNGDIIAVIRRDTELHYVFLGNLSGAVNKDIFYVLKVVTGPIIPPEPGAYITITLSFTGDKPPQLGTTVPISYPQGEGGMIPFTVSNASQYDNYATTGIIWYIDGEQVDTGQSFNLNKADDKYTMVGTYIITVEASQNGIPYAAAIMIEVTALP